MERLLFEVIKDANRRWKWLKNENFKNSSHFLLLKTMLEEHNHRALLSVNLSVVDQCNHGCWVHRLTLIELEVAELAEEPFHHTIDVLLESVHLTGSVVLFQVFHNLLHVVLEVGHVVILLGKTSLNQSVVQNKVYARF